MTSCAEARREFVAVLRGEATADVALAVEQHVARCTACAVERAALRESMDVVRAHVHPAVSADARLQLRAAVDEELARDRSRSKRRLPRAGLALPAALAAGALLAWIASPGPSGAPERATAADARIARASAVAGDLGPKSLDAASRGLAWLAARQRADGAWSPAADSGLESTAAATALTLLAFAADGQSRRHGPHAAALERAHGRLTELLGAGFGADAESKPLYAEALGVRALAAGYRLDRDSLSPQDRSRARAAAVAAGRQLRTWQRSDGGFGYVPGALRSDSSCTIFAAAALAELRRAGLLDAVGALVRAGSYLDSLRDRDGGVAYTSPGDRGGSPELTAALLALDGDLAPSRPVAQRSLAAIEGASAEGGDALLAWTGTQALARHGMPVTAPVSGLLASQRADGAWPAAADRRCAAGGDTVTTAFGVLALAQVYAR